MKNFCPGGLTPRRFLRKHWQKQPLYAPQALPQFAHLVTRDGLFELATRDDVESRLVMCSGSRWQLQHGPFPRRMLQRLPRRNWTLLVQGVNHVLPEAWQLLQSFSFIPYARLDDLMVSYAPPGGGVGPHFDSYDVFLLQGAGKRQWRISAQQDLSLLEGVPLRILRRFRPQQEWRVSTGDLLYLPPRCAHDGVALTECITLSIGFRAPDARELGVRFLEHLAERVDAEGRYSDPDLVPARHAARIDDSMMRRITRMLSATRWQDSDVGEFLGEYLTEPKPHIIFARPARPHGTRAFAAAASRHGVRLAPATQMLYRARRVFINGETAQPDVAARTRLARLADRRRLAGSRITAPVLDQLYPWYRAGYIEIDYPR